MSIELCGFTAGIDRPFFLIAGPCVVESESLQLKTAEQLKRITDDLGIPFIFKSSFDKASYLFFSVHLLIQPTGARRIDLSMAFWPTCPMSRRPSAAF